MTLLSELTSAVVKAVPQIAKHEAWPLGDRYERICINCHLVEKDGQITKKCLVGRPITLEDILRWMESIATVGENITIQADGSFDDGYSESSPAQWFLGKPLSEQSEETIAFLHSLLCPPKR